MANNNGTNKFSLKYKRNVHEKYWVVENVSWYDLQSHLREIMTNTNETEVMVILKKESGKHEK